MLAKKKVLIICYYWPPAGGSGVQRHLKFAKYLRHFGWEPIVYTVHNGEYPETDKSLLHEIPTGLTIIKRPIWEPYTFYKLFTGRKRKEKINPNFFSQKNQGILHQIAIFLRSNFFIPDARMWWIKPSVKYLKDYIQKHSIDAVISTGPPHSLHLIAKTLKEEYHIPWLADFRDPWTNIDYFKKLSLLPFAEEKHKRLEKEVLQTADRVVTVSNTWAKELAEIGQRKVEVITNGFDETDFPATKPTLDEKFTIVHPGMFSRARNHEVFWQALSELKEEHPFFAKDLKVDFYGITDSSVVELAKKYGIGNYVYLHDYLPHDKIVKVMSAAWLLLLSVHDSQNLQGFVPGKLFEYLASKRPILCIGPENGDSARIILETKSGLVSGFKDKDKLKIHIMVYYMDYVNGQKENKQIDVSKYSRKELTHRLANILNEMIDN
ncbi:MAG TPA: glycosyl transferase family 1 [Cytophagales bacterium]|nr:glycosyl transferase family 1 [Cytophagales bacterium]